VICPTGTNQPKCRSSNRYEGVTRVCILRKQDETIEALCPHDGFVADVAARSGPVLGDKGLPESPAEPLAYQTRGDVDTPARGKAGDDANGLGRVIVRRSPTCIGRSRDSDPCEFQEFTSE
jgi:hypothetical protein